MSYRHNYAKKIHIDPNKLLKEISKIIPRVEGVSVIRDEDIQDNNGTESLNSLAIGIDFPDDSPPTQNEVKKIEGIINSHDSTNFAKKVSESAVNETKTLFAGLAKLPIKDILYVAKIRSLASELNLSDAKIKGITNRVSATKYLEGTTFWLGMSKTQQNQFVIDVESWIQVLTPILKFIQEELTE